jgi:hypothetical protein
MKKMIFIFLIALVSQGRAQVDLNSLTPQQWQEDLDYLVNKIDKKFAGFTPDMKLRFAEEASAIRKAIPSLTTNQRIMEFARLLALLNDGHTEISLTGSGSGFHRFPLLLYYFNNELRIVASTIQNREVVGLRVTKIENHDVQEILEKLKPYMNMDNDIEYITTAPYLMVIPEILQVIGVLKNPVEATFTLRDENGGAIIREFQSLTLAEYNKAEFKRIYEKPPLYLKNARRGYWFEYLRDHKAMYINFITLFNQDGNDPVKKVIKEMLQQIESRKPEKLIVDFRLCRGGNYNKVLPFVQKIKANSS